MKWRRIVPKRVFPKIRVPQNGMDGYKFIMENSIEMDDFGVALFSDTSIPASFWVIVLVQNLYWSYRTSQDDWRISVFLVVAFGMMNETEKTEQLWLCNVSNSYKAILQRGCSFKRRSRDFNVGNSDQIADRIPRSMQWTNICLEGI